MSASHQQYGICCLLGRCQLRAHGVWGLLVAARWIPTPPENAALSTVR